MALTCRASCSRSKSNWYTLIPEEARAPLLKHGKVAIRFLITPSGKVAGMFVESPSGDVPLDRAAYGGISASDPVFAAAA